MDTIDPISEQQRLAARYADMSDLELAGVGDNPANLTESAREALQQEVRKRGLPWPPDAHSDAGDVERSEAADEKSLAEEDLLVSVRTYTDKLAANRALRSLQNTDTEAYLYAAGAPGDDSHQTHAVPAQPLIHLLVRAKHLTDASQLLLQEAALEKAERTMPPEDIGLESEPVVLRQYRDMPAAFVDKSVLDAAGIRSFLQDANVVRMDWLWSNAMGGIKLVVGQADAEKANLMLNAQPATLPEESASS